MILADTVRTLTSMTALDLHRVLTVSGHKDAHFDTAEFLGITNGGTFCYGVTFRDKFTPGQTARGKVFVKYNAQNHAITAEF